METANHRRYADLVYLLCAWLPYDDYGPDTLFVWAMTTGRQAAQKMVAELKGFLRQPDRDLAVLFNELGYPQMSFARDADVREFCKFAIREIKAALAVRDQPKGKRLDGLDLLRRLAADRPAGRRMDLGRPDDRRRSTGRDGFGKDGGRGPR
ncbi:MAG TPA: hypothetical protein VF796_00625 [Humisphaera sp.]